MPHISDSGSRVSHLESTADSPVSVHLCLTDRHGAQMVCKVFSPAVAVTAACECSSPCPSRALQPTWRRRRALCGPARRTRRPGRRHCLVAASQHLFRATAAAWCLGRGTATGRRAAPAAPRTARTGSSCLRWAEHFGRGAAAAAGLVGAYQSAACLRGLCIACPRWRCATAGLWMMRWHVGHSNNYFATSQQSGIGSMATFVTCCQFVLLEPWRHADACGTGQADKRTAVGWALFRCRSLPQSSDGVLVCPGLSIMWQALIACACKVPAEVTIPPRDSKSRLFQVSSHILWPNCSKLDRSLILCLMSMV